MEQHSISDTRHYNPILCAFGSVVQLWAAYRTINADSRCRTHRHQSRRNLFNLSAFYLWIWCVSPSWWKNPKKKKKNRVPRTRIWPSSGLHLALIVVFFRLACADAIKMCTSVSVCVVYIHVRACWGCACVAIHSGRFPKLVLLLIFIVIVCS